MALQWFSPLFGQALKLVEFCYKGICLIYIANCQRMHEEK